MAVSFNDASIDQLPALLRFFGAQYSHDYIFARDAQFFHWMFGGTSSEPTQNLTLKIATVDGQVAGCVGFIPVEFSAGERIVRGAWAANWMVDEKYRRLGLGPLLMREVVASFDVTLAIGANRDAHDLLPRMGWTDFGDIRRYVAVLDAEKAAALTVSGELAWPRTNTTVGHLRRATHVARITGIPDQATALWDQLYGGAAGTRRSTEYMMWRYLSHPYFQYRIFQARSGGALTGMAVYRIEQVRGLPIRIGRLVELIAIDEDAPAIVGAVLEDARAEDVAVVDFFCSSARVAPAMACLGFLSGQQPPASEVPMLFQPLDHSRNDMLFMAHGTKVPALTSVTDWYATRSDGDQDRPN